MKIVKTILLNQIGGKQMIDNLMIFSVVVGVRTAELTYIMHCLYQLSKAHEDNNLMIYVKKDVFDNMDNKLIIQ